MMIFLSSLTIILITAAVFLTTYAHIRIFNRPYFGRGFSTQPSTITTLKPSHIFVKHLEPRHWWEFWLGSWIVRLLSSESPEARERQTYAHLYLPPQKFSAPYPLVVYTHGNGAIIEEAMAWLEYIVEAGFAVLICEYRGYGDAGGHPERSFINKDLCFFYDQALNTRLIDIHNITFYGRSLGGAITCDLSLQRTAHRLIVESTFYKIKEITGLPYIPDYILAGKDFECVGAIQKFSGDILICHGTEDETSPIAQAHKLKEAKPTAELELFYANHGDIYQKPEYKASILKFLKKIETGKSV